MAFRGAALHLRDLAPLSLPLVYFKLDIFIVPSIQISIFPIFAAKSKASCDASADAKTCLACFFDQSGRKRRALMLALPPCARSYLRESRANTDLHRFARTCSPEWKSRPRFRQRRLPSESDSASIR